MVAGYDFFFVAFLAAFFLTGFLVAALARLGATRGGSCGILGYTGGHGASSMPSARSRALMASSGSMDCGFAGIVSQGSPSNSRRAGTVAMVYSSGTIVGRCSHPNGNDTCAPSRARTHHAPKIVL